MPLSDSYNQIVTELNATYLIVDPGVIKVILGTIVANRFPRDPVWLLLVTPSSGGKTEFITVLKKVKGYIEVSELTPQTFISGQKKNDVETSLLFNVDRNDVLIFKDFTTMLTMQKDARAQIMGQMREIYDKSYTRRFGNGASRTWEGKLGLLAGVTTAIYTSKQSYAAMGERFLLYNFIQPDREEFTERAMDNALTNMDERRAYLQELVRAYLDEEIKIPEDLPKPPIEIRREIIQLANLTTMARSAIQRDYASAKKEMEYVHAMEMPGRFATQLCLLLQAFMVMNDGELLEEDKNIIYKICLDSIDQNRRLVLQSLTAYSVASTANMATHLRYPTDTVRRWLEDVTALGLVDRVKKLKGHGGGDQWVLKEKWRKLLSKFDKIEMLSSEMVDDDAIVENDAPLAKLDDLTPDEQAALQGSLGFAADDPGPTEPIWKLKN